MKCSSVCDGVPSPVVVPRMRPRPYSISDVPDSTATPTVPSDSGMVNLAFEDWLAPPPSYEEIAHSHNPSDGSPDDVLVAGTPHSQVGFTTNSFDLLEERNSESLKLNVYNDVSSVNELSEIIPDVTNAKPVHVSTTWVESGIKGSPLDGSSDVPPVNRVIQQCDKKESAAVQQQVAKGMSESVQFGNATITIHRAYPVRLHIQEDPAAVDDDDDVLLGNKKAVGISRGKGEVNEQQESVMSIIHLSPNKPQAKATEHTRAENNDDDDDDVLLGYKKAVGISRGKGEVNEQQESVMSIIHLSPNKPQAKATEHTRAEEEDDDDDDDVFIEKRKAEVSYDKQESAMSIIHISSTKPQAKSREKERGADENDVPVWMIRQETGPDLDIQRTTDHSRETKNTRAKTVGGITFPKNSSPSPQESEGQDKKQVEHTTLVVQTPKQNLQDNKDPLRQDFDSSTYEVKKGNKEKESTATSRKSTPEVKVNFGPPKYFPQERVKPTTPDDESVGFEDKENLPTTADLSAGKKATPEVKVDFGPPKYFSQIEASERDSSTILVTPEVTKRKKDKENKTSGVFSRRKTPEFKVDYGSPKYFTLDDASEEDNSTIVITPEVTKRKNDKESKTSRRKTPEFKVDYGPPQHFDKRQSFEEFDLRAVTLPKDHRTKKPGEPAEDPEEVVWVPREVEQSLTLGSPKRKVKESKTKRASRTIWYVEDGISFDNTDEQLETSFEFVSPISKSSSDEARVKRRPAKGEKKKKKRKEGVSSISSASPVEYSIPGILVGHLEMEVKPVAIEKSAKLPNGCDKDGVEESSGDAGSTMQRDIKKVPLPPVKRGHAQSDTLKSKHRKSRKHEQTDYSDLPWQVNPQVKNVTPVKLISEGERSTPAGASLEGPPLTPLTPSRLTTQKLIFQLAAQDIGTPV